MIAIGSFKPEGDNWQCALCKPYSGEQGAWYTNIICDDGKLSSFICEHHKHMSLEEIMGALNKRAVDRKTVKFRYGDIEDTFDWLCRKKNE